MHEWGTSDGANIPQKVGVGLDGGAHQRNCTVHSRRVGRTHWTGNSTAAVCRPHSTAIAGSEVDVRESGVRVAQGAGLQRGGGAKHCRAQERGGLCVAVVLGEKQVSCATFLSPAPLHTGTSNMITGSRIAVCV